MFLSLGGDLQGILCCCLWVEILGFISEASLWNKMFVQCTGNTTQINYECCSLLNMAHNLCHDVFIGGDTHMSSWSRDFSSVVCRSSPSFTRSEMRLFASTRSDFNLVISAAACSWVDLQITMNTRL